VIKKFWSEYPWINTLVWVYILHILGRISIGDTLSNIKVIRSVF